jgi:TonB-linked SusC/RagA family outer membrane protein
MEMMDANGNYNRDPYNVIVDNPIGVINVENGQSMSDIVTGMFDLRFKILPGLTFSTTNGVDYYDSKSYSFGSLRVTTGSNSAGNSDNYRMMLQSTNNLTYTGKWGLHSLTATGVWEATRSESRSISASGKNFPVESVTWWNLGMATNQFASNSYSKWTLLSGVGRVMYNYADKYMLTGTLRADGSSKFSKDQWGWFPSIAVAWNLSNEEFMKKQDFFTNVKLRTSYGVVGNQAISPYSTLGLMSAASTYFGGTSQYTGYWSKSLATPNVTWEKTKQFDFGIDFSMLDGRIDVSFDYFNRKTTDGLLQKTIPNYNGGGTYWVNAGKIRNRGIDLTVTGHILRDGGWTWNSTVNMTYNKNKVISLAGDKFISGSTPASGMVTEVNRVIVGQPIGVFYGYKWAGLNDKGQNTYYNSNNEVVTSDKVTSADRRVIGESVPKVTMGWNNQVAYKNWDLSAFFTGSFGAKKLNLVRFAMASMVGDSKFITLRDAYYKGYDYLYKTTGSGAGAEYPSYTNTYSSRGESSQWLENANYVRLENLTLAYNLSKAVSKIADFRFYVSVQNLFTITKYKGMDPASNSFSNDNVDINSGIDLGAYPTPRTYTLGVRINF